MQAGICQKANHPSASPRDHLPHSLEFGRNTWVLGTGKGGQIVKSPLLSWYWDIFKKVLSVGDVRLLIVGYGFGDEHVNAVIADAVEHHGLKVFIWDTAPNLPHRVPAAIWKGLLTIATRPMVEVVPHDRDDETQEFRRIKETLFS